MSQKLPLTRQELDVLAEQLLQHFGQVLQRRRHALDLTLEDVHQALGIDGSNLSHFENGKKRAAAGKKRASMTLKNFLKLKLYYDVGWQQLLQLPPSRADRLITRVLQLAPAAQESLLYLLDHGCGDAPLEDSASLPSCIAAASS